MLERDQSADDPLITPHELQITSEMLRGLCWLPDGGAFRVPDHLSAGRGFEIEAWWRPDPQRLERIERCYDESGSWMSSRHVLLNR